MTLSSSRHYTGTWVEKRQERKLAFDVLAVFQTTGLCIDPPTKLHHKIPCKSISDTKRQLSWRGIYADEATKNPHREKSSYQLYIFSWRESVS